MLSHLRFHRRAPSNPPSPLPDSDAVAQREHPHPARGFSPRPDARPRSSDSSQLPPTLPPIARVTSTGSDDLFASRDDVPPHSQHAGKPSTRSGFDGEAKAGFIGGVALENYRRATQASQPADFPAMAATPGQIPDSQLSRSKPPPPPINTGLGPLPAVSVDKPAKSTWFSTPTDFQGPGGPPSKRPAGPRLASEPTPGLGPEPHKGRKGLPFLKNPMSSLLMRRKTAQAAAESQQPAPSYDPRIRGTRVHDFSAPRPKKTPSISDAGSTRQEAANSDRGDPSAFSPPTEAAGGGIREAKLTAGGDVQPGSGLTQEPPLPPVPTDDEPAMSLRASLSDASRETSGAPLPPATSVSVRTSASRQLSISELSKRDSTASAVPKHMKSTSSRFSFDMIGAAKQERLLEERHRQREQEKKTSEDPADMRFDDFDEDFDYDAMMDDDGLEERIPGVNADYDEDEDAEAALDPDNDQENFAGFVFQRSNPASSLASPHTPAILATPRDANGKVIGFALTKDTTPEPSTTDSPRFPSLLELPRPDESSGLGAEVTASNSADGQQSVFRPSYQVPSTAAPLPPPRADDDLYFDDGLADELDFEHDGTVFDESIFDNNDTDPFGRPIPGAFAHAQEAMREAQKQQQQQQQQQPSKRDSDVTSSASAQSGTVDSTGHTSLSTGPQPLPGQQVTVLDALLKQPPDQTMPPMGIPGQDLAYQAALAEAAQKAAASGKFRRSSSPEVLAGLAGAHRNDSLEQPTTYLNDYEDDGFANDFDDFDFDDEAIIAEANASALANDSDGFYGQEFGFYSAPIPQPPYAYHHHSTHHSNPSPSSSSSSPGGSGISGPGGRGSVLTTESLFQYANGGYFGPPGAAAALNRSTSGRVVSREPNLTPITERSEYSNRNSVMSFTLPPAIGSAAASDGGGGGGGRSSMASPSPGLAQLALLAADGDAADPSMSLSALMKLRSKAWGGSQASLASSSREGGSSPRSERAVPLDVAAAVGGVGGGASSPFGTVPAHLAGHVRVNSGLSLWSCSEEAEAVGDVSGAASPTMGPPAAAATQPPGFPSSSAGGGVAINTGINTAIGLGMGLGTGMRMVPPRPGSAGASVNGSGGGGGAATTSPPLPLPLPLSPRPQSLCLPPLGPSVSVQSPGQIPGGSACSPVLEGEEAEPDLEPEPEHEPGAPSCGGDVAADGPGLAPALPLRAKGQE